MTASLRHHTSLIHFGQGNMTKASPLKNPTIDCDVYSGDQCAHIRLMEIVEKRPLEVGHTFEQKETMMIRIAEEANLRNQCPFPLHLHGSMPCTQSDILIVYQTQLFAQADILIVYQTQLFAKLHKQN